MHNLSRKEREINLASQPPAIVLLAGLQGAGKTTMCGKLGFMLKKQGKTLIDKLNEVYDEFGRFTHRLKSKEFAGASGNAKMKQLLTSLYPIQPQAVPVQLKLVFR